MLGEAMGTLEFDRQLVHRPTALVAVAALMATLLHGISVLAQGKPLPKVRLVVATASLGVTYPEFTLPSWLGYWQQEGYDVDVQPGGGSLQAIQQMVGGNAEFAAGSGNAMIQFNEKNNLPIRIAYNYGITDWSIAVDADGPIKSVKDLKGKTIGVFSLATGGIGMMNALLRENGMDPAKDVELLPVGLGAPPVQAMRSGKIQGLLYWGGGIASFENAGLKLRKIVGKDWPGYPDYSLVTMQGTADKNPDMVIKIARGTAKAELFAMTNPTCAIKLTWKNDPASRASGDEATALKNDLHSLEAQLLSMSEAYRTFGQGKLWGRFDPPAWNKLSSFMIDAKQINKPFDGAKLGLQIPNLYEKISDFDAEAVRASARECKI
jgi:NitT/TauT family transport system substrate-binding protein